MASELSYIASIAKLLKHTDKLKGYQQGVISPIMVHIMPTHRCQLNCVHCCFKNRIDYKKDLDEIDFDDAIVQFRNLGVRALELTGGGEPTLYPKIDEALDFMLSMGFAVGLITNGIALHRIHKHIENLSWIRISLNTLDYDYDLHFSMQRLKNVDFSFCYIWNEHSEHNINLVSRFIKKYKKPCRIGANAIQPLFKIKQDECVIEAILSGIDNDYFFLHKVPEQRTNNNCFIHLIKPALYTDSYIYPCPSAELALENNKQINKDLRLCHASQVYNFYKSSDFIMKREHDCSFCKYSEHQRFFENLLAETEFNEFA